MLSGQVLASTCGRCGVNLGVRCNGFSTLTTVIKGAGPSQTTGAFSGLQHLLLAESQRLVLLKDDLWLSEVLGEGKSLYSCFQMFSSHSFPLPPHHPYWKKHASLPMLSSCVLLPGTRYMGGHLLGQGTR